MELSTDEREELNRLREYFQARISDRNLRYATALAGFIWGSLLRNCFDRDEEKLWKALPSETQQMLLDFVVLTKKGPVIE